MERKRNGTILTLRILLTALCVAMLAFIFVNSLQTGEESSDWSERVVTALQKLVGVFAPDSRVATATGEDYERLHGAVRTAAHFTEFALLGALLVWCYRAYTREKAFFFVPVCLLVLVPIVDEFLQTMSAGRAADIADVFVDTLGGFCGCLFAILTLWVGISVYKRKRRK